MKSFLVYKFTCASSRFSYIGEFVVILKLILRRPFVNLGIGNSALELELELILQTSLFLVSLGLVGCWFRIKRTSPTKVTLYYDILVTWQKKNVISLFSQGLWTPKLAGWWLRMRGTHLQSHVALQYRGHVTNKKQFISTFTGPVDPKLSSVVT